MSTSEDTLDAEVVPRDKNGGHEVRWLGGGWMHRRYFADEQDARSWARLLPWRTGR